MGRSFLGLIAVIAMAAMCNWTAYGQGGSTSSLTGWVTDPAGSVIPGAQVTIKNHATSAEFKAVTAGNGTFSIPALDAGLYHVTISAAGFKQVVITDVKVDVGTPASVRATLEVGNTSESIVVQGGGEIMQTQSATISTTLNVNQIANLPLVSRNTLNFITLLPGTSTPRGNRDSTINGLPQSSISISIDGINSQDKYLKSTDGFFSMLSPSIDTIEEVTVSTAAPGAESSGQGSVQIKFVTRQGNNQLHGSVYEYHRNPWLNANYWFNNRDLPASPGSDRAPRDRVLFNQYGFRLGGPLLLPKKAFGPMAFDGRDRAFFFFNYEEFRQPTQITRQRTILNPEAQRGIFQYNVQGGVQRIDLLALTDAVNPRATIDPTIGRLLADIRNSTDGTGGIQQLADPNLQRFTFTNNSDAKRYSPTLRLDFNVTDRQHLEISSYYTKTATTIDTLNGIDPAFPNFPNRGGQFSDRFSMAVALRSTLTPTLVNEARFGITGGTSSFRPEISAEMFNGAVANQAGFNLGAAPGGTGIAAAMGINGATVTSNTSRRNTPFKQFSDNLIWTRGAHGISFGGTFTQTDLWVFNQTMVPSLNFGVAAGDPANSLFTAANFPGASTADLARAQNFYAALTGRVIAINANAQLDEQTGEYQLLGPNVQRARQREFGLYVQDSWRVRPSLTLNYGVRWQVQLPFTPLNNNYTTTTVADLFGVSGAGNLFKPGVMTGRETQFTQYRAGDRAYNVDYHNFAPSFGFAWNPQVKGGWLKRIIGEGSGTVLRGGYSLTYDNQGMATFSDRYGANPGSFVTASRSTTLGNLVTGNDRLPVLLRESQRLGAGAFPSTPGYPLKGAVTDAARIFDPNLKVPYVQSWTFGVQRELNRDTAVEVRYVGTRSLRGWVDYNLNAAADATIVENGFLDEFKLAMANLQANIAAGRGNNFRYYGPGTGTAPLPIFLAHFSGLNAAAAASPNNYGSGLFANANFVNQLAPNNPNPYALASSGANSGLFGQAAFRDNALRAGLPANFFVTNPGLLGGAIFTGNGGYTRYDSMVVELRRRLSHGLLVQGSYTWAKGFISSRVSLRAPRINTVGTGADSVPRHSFKANWVYELPFGRGQALFGRAGGRLDRLIGGWEFHGTARIQSGEVLNFGNVNLVGMTRGDLQQAFKLRFDDARKIAYSLPQDIIDNTIRAFNVSATSATGYGQLGRPAGRYLAPASNRNCIQVVNGDCAPQSVAVYGPQFTRFDLSAVKKVKLTERVNFELRGEFLNAFNHINFFANTNLTNFNNQLFGQVTSAYRDINNTNDTGGRQIQIVARFNF